MIWGSNRFSEGIPCLTNKGVSYTNLVSGLVVNLKLDDDHHHIIS
jgi:hypothetical protein